MTERPDPNAAHAQTLRDLKADDPDFEPDPVFDDGPDFYDDPGPAYWPRTARRPRRSVWPSAILGITLVVLVAMAAAVELGWLPEPW